MYDVIWIIEGKEQHVRYDTDQELKAKERYVKLVES